MKTIKAIMIVTAIIILSGCVNTNDQTSKLNPKTNTMEFNLKGDIKVVPSTPIKGTKISITYTLYNEGTEEITILPEDAMISLSCAKSISEYKTIPSDVVGLPLYILDPGESLSFIWDVETDPNHITYACKGSIYYTYEDNATYTKYLQVINEKELTNPGFEIKHNRLETFNDGNIRIKAYVVPSDTIILNENTEQDNTLVIEIENVGDGEIKIGKIRIDKDENIIINNKCSKTKDNTLKPREKETLMCKISFKEIPDIKERYRIDISIPYRVYFTKTFEFKFQENTLPVGRAINNIIAFDSKCSRFKIPSLGSLSISLGKDFKEICTLIMTATARLYVVSAVNYAKEVYGYDDGKYWGYEIYGRKYAKAFAKASYDKEIKESLPQCLQTISSQIRENECERKENHEKEIKSCSKELYNLVDESKVKNRLIDPRKEKAFNKIKRYAERGINKYKSTLSRTLNKIYDEEIGEEMRQYNTIDLGGLRIKTNINRALNDLLVKQSVKLLIPVLDNNKEEILKNYEEGFKEGFKVGFINRLEDDLIDNLENYCYYGD